MFEELNNQLKEIKEKIREKERLLIRADNLREELEIEKAKLKNLKEALGKERKDVEKLEGMSIGGLIFTLIGKKEEKLQKEKEEYIIAKVKYDECENTVNALSEEAEKIKFKLDALRNIKEEHEKVLKIKEEAIIQKGLNEKSELIEISRDISKLEMDVNETKEAILEGHSLLNAIDKLIDSLKKAANWGAFDMLGGGVLSTAVKHSHIDKAKDHSYQVKNHVRRFKRELKDLDKSLDLQVNLGSFVTFADFFLDGLFVDWYVQSSINKALNQATDLKHSVNSIVNNLGREKSNGEKKVNNLKQKYKSIIESADN